MDVINFFVFPIIHGNQALIETWINHYTSFQSFIVPPNLLSIISKLIGGSPVSSHIDSTVGWGSTNMYSDWVGLGATLGRI